MCARTILCAVASIACGVATAAGQSDATAATPDTVVTACSSADHRAFDFWIGEWEVANPAGAPAGRSSITRVLGGCAIHEEWRGAGGTRGNSYSLYEAASGRWHQHWVDTGGNLLSLSGGVVDGAMVLDGRTTTPTGTAQQRVTWSRESNGRVRQHWQMTSDGGASWTTSFDGMYRRANGAEGAAPPPASVTAAGAGPLAALAFMAGCWRGDFANGAALEEQYTAPSANLMLGTSRFMRGDRAVQHEFSRITADSAGVIILQPFPDGRPSEHGFRLTSVASGDALFEAPEHDFPKRIRYTRSPDGSITARIDGGEGDAQVQEWRMQRARCGGS